MSSIVFRAKPGHKSDYGRYCIDIDGQEDIAEDKQLVSERIVKITLHYIQLSMLTVLFIIYHSSSYLKKIIHAKNKLILQWFQKVVDMSLIDVCCKHLYPTI